ncbi:MAG: mechanosensitive ion channel, partial [Thermoplasmata archaeon]|nr:mechanosensitive ion channel [Thermoplasmata archaeon]
KQPAAHVKMVDFGESSVDMELWAWIDDARQREIVRSDLLMAIKKRFDKEGIEIPYPHRTIVFKKDLDKEMADALEGRGKIKGRET